MIDSGIDHEFRTTIVREQLEVSDFEKIGELVKGAKRFALQHFRTGTTISPKFANYHTFTDEEFREAQKIMEITTGRIDQMIVSQKRSNAPVNLFVWLTSEPPNLLAWKNKVSFANLLNIFTYKSRITETSNVHTR